MSGILKSGLIGRGFALAVTGWLGVTLTLSAQGTAANAAPSTAGPAATATNPGARLREGDQIEIRLGGVPPDEIMQVTGAYQVDGEGFLNLPHVGKVKAAGLNQSELQNAIESAYRKAEIYTHPTITVNVPAQARFVNVGGEVKMERRVEYTPDLTIIAAINAASGFTEFANQGRVQLIRVGQEKPIIIDVKRARKNPELDVKLEPGDRIFVPRSFW